MYVSMNDELTTETTDHILTFISLLIKAHTLKYIVRYMSMSMVVVYNVIFTNASIFTSSVIQKCVLSSIITPIYSISDYVYMLQFWSI